MQWVKPKVLFAIIDSIKVLMDAAKLENVSTKFIVLDKHSAMESLEDILSSITAEEVENFQPQFIEDPKTTPAIIFQTTGSTGDPKGVLHSYKFIIISCIYY